MRIRSLRVRRSPKVMAVVAIAAGALLASVMPVSADVSTDSPSVGAIRIESPAMLEARGAAITVPITVVCLPGSSGYISIQVTQRVGGAIASGGSSMQLPVCTGGAQTVDITLQTYSEPFRKGTAFGSASLYAYPGTATDEREFEIDR